MMTPRQALVAIVKDDAQTFGLHQGRVYPSVAPQRLTQKVPYVCVHNLGGEDGYSLDGPDGKPQADFQLEVWDTDTDRCEYLAWRLRHVLNGFSGTVKTLRIEACECGLPDEDTEEDDNLASQLWYRQRMNVKFFFTEQPTPRLLADATA